MNAPGKPSRAAFAFVFVTVALDMLALGVMIPVLPELSRELSGGDTASVRVRRVTEKGAGPAVTVAASTAARASGFPRMALSGDSAYFAWTVPGRPASVRVARANAADFR